MTRKIWGLLVLLACMTLAACQSVPQGQVGVDITTAIDQAKDKVYPALVRIDARRYYYRYGKKMRSGGTGSGFVIDNAGHVLTNYHVAGEAEEIKCTLYNKEIVSATLVGSDPWTDLALLKLNMDELKKKKIKLYVSELGRSSDVRVGEYVLAMGTPYGLSRSVSLGIISNRERFLGGAMRLPDGKSTGVFNNWIQTDASINPGNSGGPLVNLKGKVIGVNARAITGASTGFAIPIDIAREVAESIRTSDDGKVVRSWLGLQFQKTQDLERYLETGKNEGVIVAQVEKNSPAEKAGIKPLDVLVKINDVDVSARFDEEIPKVRKMIADMPVGSDVRLVVLRDHQKKEFSLETLRLGASLGDDEEIKEWGCTVRAITPKMAQNLRLDDTYGVQVTGVKSNELAAKAGLKSGDIITHVDKAPVKGLDSFRELAQKAAAAEKNVILKVKRDKAVNFILIKKD